MLNGVQIAQIMDIGYNNVESVIEKLKSMLPSFVPDRAMVEYVIDNIDDGEKRTYKRQHHA